jgi:hypothetical protein
MHSVFIIIFGKWLQKEEKIRFWLRTKKYTVRIKRFVSVDHKNELCLFFVRFLKRTVKFLLERRICFSKESMNLTDHIWELGLENRSGCGITSFFREICSKCTYPHSKANFFWISKLVAEYEWNSLETSRTHVCKNSCNFCEIFIFLQSVLWSLRI